MKIVVAGAGDVGFHLAQLLAKENQDITLIDNNPEILEYAANHLDVLTVKGDATSAAVLNEAEVSRARLFLGVTASEKTNLLSSLIAKKLGARQTIARINNPEYLKKGLREIFRELGVDNVFSPQQLAAEEIVRLLERCSVTDIYDFEDGQLSAIGFTIDAASPMVGKTIEVINKETPNFLFRSFAILRRSHTLIPSANTIIEKGDHLYLVTKNENINELTAFAGKSIKKVHSVMVVGGKGLGGSLAKMIDGKYSVTLIENDRERCKDLAEKLHNTLVVHGDASNIDLLKEEGLENMDAFIALTPNSESNIISSLVASENGVFKTIAHVDNMVYTHISKNIGVDTLINQKLIAANNIFRFVRKGKIETIMSLHGVDAEIIEFVIHRNNRVTKNPLKDLHFPKTATIIAVIREDSSLIPNGETQLQLGDKVIVFLLPEAIKQVETLFH